MNLFQLMQTHPIVNCILHQSFTVNYRSDTVDSIKAFYNVFQFFAMQLFPYIKTQSKIISASCIQLEQASNPPPPIVMARYIVSIYRHILIILSTSRAHTLSLSLFLILSSFLSLSIFLSISSALSIEISLSTNRRRLGKYPILIFNQNYQKCFETSGNPKYFLKKEWAKPGLFCLFWFFSYDKNSPNLTINDKSVDGVLGIRTGGGRMVGAEKSTELRRHPYAQSYKHSPIVNLCYGKANLHF